MWISLSAVHASVYYVATDGSNAGTGAIDDPWATISYAVGGENDVAAGDTIYVRGGTYSNENIVPAIPGEFENMIKVWEYPDETVICDSCKINVVEDSVRFWHFKGLRIQYSDDSGVTIKGSGRGSDPDTLCFLFEQMEIKHSKYDGFFCGKTEDPYEWGSLKVLDSSIDSNGIWGGVIQPDGEGCGFYLAGSEYYVWLHRDTMRYNWVKAISFGDQYVLSPSMDSSVVCSCYIWDTYEMGIGWVGDSSYLMYNYFAWNGFRDTEAEEYGDQGLCIFDSAIGNFIHHNLIRSSGSQDFSPKGAGNIIYNNTFVKTHKYTTLPGSPYVATILVYMNDDDGNIYRNNISYNAVSDYKHIYPLLTEIAARYSGQDWDYNCWWSVYADSTIYDPYGYSWKTFKVPDGGAYKTFYELRQTYPTQEVHGINQDPLFTAYADSDYTLAYNSPCIDAGQDTICTDPLIILTDYYGDAPDIGCYEYFSAPPSLTTAPYLGPIGGGRSRDFNIVYAGGIDSTASDMVCIPLPWNRGDGCAVLYVYLDDCDWTTVTPTNDSLRFSYRPAPSVTDTLSGSTDQFAWTPLQIYNGPSGQLDNWDYSITWVDSVWYMCPIDMGGKPWRYIDLKIEQVANDCTTCDDSTDVYIYLDVK